MRSPSTVAVTVAVPADTAVTRPSLSIVATLVRSMLHSTSRSESSFPSSSLTVAWNRWVSVTSSSTDAGDTSTVATPGGLTVIEAVAVFPSISAVRVALPPATAVTRPLELTVATDCGLMLHDAVRPERTLSFES